MSEYVIDLVSSRLRKWWHPDDDRPWTRSSNPAQNEWVGARWKEGQKVLRAAEIANNRRLKNVV